VPYSLIGKIFVSFESGLIFFWQRPKTVEKKMEDIWFDIAAVGKNTLGDKMKILSQKYNLSAVYTNHSLRSITLTMLDNEGFEARHIMAISGHKTETSIRSYSRTDDSKRRKNAKSFSDKIIGTGRYNVYELLLT
jgi:hypothetical protein